MARSKANKPSSSTSRPAAADPRGRRPGLPARAPSRFSLWHYPFAVPPGLRVLLRLAAPAVLLLLSPLAARAEPGSLWRPDGSRSTFADQRARPADNIRTIPAQETPSASKTKS